jgi:hypothetical protein
MGFDVELQPSPTFAMLYRGHLRLLLGVPSEPHVLPNGTLPVPGGHNRIVLVVGALRATIATLRRRGRRLPASSPGHHHGHGPRAGPGRQPRSS